MCAGISEDEYEIIGDPSPNIMFFCSICRPKVSMALKFFNEIEQKQKSLDNKVKQLEEKITSLTSSVANSTAVITTQSPETSLTNTNDAVVTQPPDITNKSAAPPKPPPLVPDSRYNVVLYGIVESPSDTPRSDRQKHDLDQLLNVLSNIDASLTAASIRDFHRLGKFKPSNTRPRPLLVKFLRTFEASIVLSKKDSLASSLQHVSIKRDMSLEERQIENALLKERRSLIDSGIERKFIKIRGNSLYVKNKLHGIVQGSQFHTTVPKTLEHNKTQASTAQISGSADQTSASSMEVNDSVPVPASNSEPST